MHLGPFDVPEGEEVQDCHYVDVPTDGEVDVTRIQFAYADGSHHVNVYRTEDPDAMRPDGTVEEGCWDALDWDRFSLVANSQLERLDWTLPDEAAIRIGPTSQLLVQVHYVNVASAEQTTPGGEGEAFVNFHAEPGGTRAHAMGALFANNRSIELPPHSYSAFTASCMLPEGANVVALAGHFHRHGVEFTANRFFGATEARASSLGEEVYRSQRWSEPEFATFDAGALVLGPDEGLAYTCTFYNDEDETITFGPHVEYEEHCNLFGYYFPADETTTFCF